MPDQSISKCLRLWLLVLVPKGSQGFASGREQYLVLFPFCLSQDGLIPIPIRLNQCLSNFILQVPYTRTERWTVPPQNPLSEINPGICLLTHVDDKRCESWLNNLCYTTHFQFILSCNFADKEYLSKSAFWAVINFLASSHASFKNTSYKSYVSIFNISLVWFFGGKKVIRIAM